MTGASILLENIVLRRKTHTTSLNLRIAPSSLNAIIGSNGAGKSTLLNIIAGFEKPNEGRVLINSVDVTNTTPDKRPVSMIFQGNNLFPHLTVRTNIELGRSPLLRLSEKDHAAVAKALKQTDLKKYEKTLPNELSEGERQRVAIARCLVRERPILLLDEPFSSLDTSLRSEMLNLIQSLFQEKKMTILLVSHDINDTKKIANTMIFIKNGTIVQKLYL